MGKETPRAFSEEKKTEILRRRDPDFSVPGVEHGFSGFEPPLLAMRADHRDPGGFTTACFVGQLVLAPPGGKGRFVDR